MRDSPPDDSWVTMITEQWRFDLCPEDPPSPLATPNTSSSVTSLSPRSSSRCRSSFSISTLISLSSLASSMRLRPRSEPLCWYFQPERNFLTLDCLRGLTRFSVYVTGCHICAYCFVTEAKRSLTLPVERSSLASGVFDNAFLLKCRTRRNTVPHHGTDNASFYCSSPADMWQLYFWCLR